jgi:osmotically inducible protein OsmC
MALSAQLGAAGFTAEAINTTARLKMDKQDSGWAISAIHLDVSARVPKADAAAFQKAAENAKTGCPVSKVLNAQITMSAKLE